jgi:hypothetical protein
MEIEAHSRHATTSIEIPKIDEKELGRALPESKPTGPQDCRQTVDFSRLVQTTRPLTFPHESPL